VVPLNSEEEQDLRRLLAMLDRVKSLVERVSSNNSAQGVRAEKHSPLSTDDQKAHPYRVTDRAWLSLSVAVDFIECLRRSLIEELSAKRVKVRIHPYAQLALVRGAVESAATAICLLGQPRTSRIFVRLSLEWHELKPAYALRSLANQTPPRPIEVRQQELVDLLLAAGFPVAAGKDRSKSSRAALDSFRYVDVVRRAGDAMSTMDARIVEGAWRACSGIAHGDTNAILGLLATAVEQFEPGMQLMQVSAPVQLLYGASMIAMGLTTHAFVLLDRQTQAPFAPFDPGICDVLCFAIARVREL
jgi:hypothetical protein